MGGVGPWYAVAMAARFTYRLELAYDGSRFAGFQAQRGQRTVESVLLAGIGGWVPELRRVAVGGRTDRGVHALGQVVSFWSRAPIELEALRERLETSAEGELLVLEMRPVPSSFHASFSAVSRSYAYRLRAPGLDVSRLDALVGALVGRRCFSAFARDTPREQSTVRRLMRARVLSEGEGAARFELTADGFLRRQVRVIVATAVRAMAEGAPLDALLSLCESGDRGATAPPAPAEGLWLMAVGY